MRSEPDTKALALAWLALVAGCGGEAPSADGGASAEDDGPAAVESVDEEAAAVQALQALGYAGEAPALEDDEAVGVLLHDRERAAQGLSLYTSSGTCAANLIDMEGELVHSWQLPSCGRWGNSLLLPDGDLVVTGRDWHDRSDPEAVDAAHYIARLDWDGELVWKRQMHAHHDVDLMADGNLATLTYANVDAPAFDEDHPTRDQLVAILGPDGELLREVSILEVVRRLSERGDLETMHRRPIERNALRHVDLLHANTIEFGRHGHLFERHALFGPRAALVCLRHQNVAIAFDVDTLEPLWWWGADELSGPHDATRLPNGNVLIFDNGLSRRWSRVVEVDPLKGEIVWEYGPSAVGESFYTVSQGSSQRLSNGNTLIVESDRGIAFEVTPAGEKVWAFRNFDMTNAREPIVIVRMRRYEGLTFDALRERVAAGTVPRED